MYYYNNILGKRFGNLVVIEKTEKRKRRCIIWKCKCDCGNITFASSHSLNCGYKKSCGCKMHRGGRKYGDFRTHDERIYTIWIGIKDRCSRKNNAGYDNYGGRGISVCDEWVNDFKAFYDWSIKNGYKDTLTIDRINNNGNYEPKNCRWASMEQQANNRRSNHLLTYHGETRNIKEWAEKYDIPESRLRMRLWRGMDLERALNNSDMRFSQ